VNKRLSSITLCSLVALDTKCPQSCSLATVFVLSRVYATVTWQWVYKFQVIVAYRVAARQQILTNELYATFTG
jgi:hypothetical protein